MNNETATYKEMYEGPMLVHDPDASMYRDNEPIYYCNDIGYEITHTHKLAQDKPTIVIKIPLSKLCLNDFGTVDLNDFGWVTATFCYDRFRTYIDFLNSELCNRSRPDNENGKYILSEQTSVIIPNNYAYFAECLPKWYDDLAGISVMTLKRSTPISMEKMLHFRIQVQLPRRKIRKTIQMLCRDLPGAVERFINEFDPVRLNRALELAKKQAGIREWMKNSDYCAFVANGSILPRSKGTCLPMENSVPFKSPPDDEIEVCGVRGMGIRKGVTVITGGGYSGKSTLLDAVSSGIYDHISGDGRELCITDASAVSISAEDGRSVKHVNITPFIKWLPGGDTTDFSTDHASGSTSQAANIMEAVDCGAKLLLIDEDQSATNFMIRDRMMKELIAKEPITPFTDRVNELHKIEGVSTILVIGGSGEYLAVADKIYMMEDYLIRDVTEKARAICTSHGVTAEAPSYTDWRQKRILYSEHFSSYPTGSGSEKLEVSDMGFIHIGDDWIDVRGLHDTVSKRQLDALGFILRYLMVSNKEHKIDIVGRVDELYEKMEAEGMDILYSSYFTTTERFLDLPRKTEVYAIVNRMRSLNFAKERL